MHFRQQLVLIALAQCAFGGATLGGTIRYDLPELLGEHRSDGTRLVVKRTHVNTPLGIYAVRQARLVIEGTVAPGKARGDGILLQAVEFDLETNLQANASFNHSTHLPTTAITGSFRIDESYLDPFVPEPIPLPNPLGYPPVSFSIGLGILLSFSTNFPPTIVPDSGPYDATEGIVVDVPIIADVTTAYIELSGPTIVPEPSAAVTTLLGLLFCVCCRSVKRDCSSPRNVLDRVHGIDCK